jgi:uncharacterized membrane protein
MTPIEQVHHEVATVLRIGFRIAAAFLIIGIVIALVRQEPLASEADRFVDIPGAVADLRARGFIDLAIVTIVLTPVSAVVRIWLGFRSRGEKRFAAYTLGVVAVLVASIALSVSR